MGKYEVTQAQFQSIMGSNPSRSTKSPDCPVDNVSEDDARKFCLTLSERTGLNSRLPTEAEWEYASRAGKSTKWFFGDDGSKIGDYAWFKGNAGGKSHPVGQRNRTLGDCMISMEMCAKGSRINMPVIIIPSVLKSTPLAQARDPSRTWNTVLLHRVQVSIF